MGRLQSMYSVLVVVELISKYTGVLTGEHSLLKFDAERISGTAHFLPLSDS